MDRRGSFGVKRSRPDDGTASTDETVPKRSDSRAEDASDVAGTVSNSEGSRSVVAASDLPVAAPAVVGHDVTGNQSKVRQSGAHWGFPPGSFANFDRRDFGCTGFADFATASSLSAVVIAWPLRVQAPTATAQSERPCEPSSSAGFASFSAPHDGSTAQSSTPVYRSSFDYLQSSHGDDGSGESLANIQMYCWQALGLTGSIVVFSFRRRGCRCAGFSHV
jgi:hypothetical protein